MRVAVDASCLAWPGEGGIQRYLRNVLEHLAAREDLRLDLLVNSRRSLDGFDEDIQSVRRVRGGAAWRTTFVTWHLHRSRPDVFWAPRLPAPLSVPCPFVLTLHDLAPAMMRGSKPFLEDLAFRTTFPWAARHADRVISVSERTRQDAVEQWTIDPGRITVIPLAVDARFSPGPADEARRDVERRFGITRPFVLHVGSIEVRKGLETLLDAAEACRDGGIDVVLAGSEGFGSEAIVARARATPNCRLLGRVSDDDLVALYRAAEVVVLPSLYEGFGLPALEAMACGTPVAVAAGAGSLPELFGAAATVVPDRSPEAWRAAIGSSRSERARLAAAGIVLAARYSWTATARATADVLRAATSG